MALHVVVGRGPIGTHLTRQLSEAGHRVRVVARTAGAATVDARVDPLGLVEHVTADASDADALSRAAQGAVALYNCLNPAYHRWATDWPPMMTALLAAAESSGAVLVSAGNLYPYGPDSGVMTEQTPPAGTDEKGRIRQQLWELALAAQDSGRARVTEIRGSDYLGPLALGTAHAGERLFASVLSGRTVRPIGNPDAPHSWTYLPDFARMMRAAALDERAWGRLWHAPSPEPRSIRQLVSEIATVAGVPVPKIAPISVGMVKAIGLFNPMMREMARVGYQHDRPFVMDSSAAQESFGQAPTDWPTILGDTVNWWQQREAVTAR